MPALFAVTLFVSATLLFLIQPLIAKMILPLLGGMPTVWISCMLFFQAVLLAGYSYAHAVSRRLTTRRQALFHVGLIVLPALALPLLTLPLQMLRGEASAAGPAGWIGPPPTDASPIPWLLGLLLLTVGLPFFALATTAPLLQRWFARTGHPSARDPYFLYGASNLGSMLALLGYPVLLEPSLGLGRQSGVWMVGYGLLVVLVAACAFVVWRAPAETPAGTPVKKVPTADAAKPSSAPAVAPTQRLRWVALAFVPSGLLFGVTTYLSTDLAAVPLLWVIPLALYLLTFILVFARASLVPHRWVVLLLPVLILLQLGQVLGHLTEPKWPAMLLHLLLFFGVALFCHGELARSRPPVEHLTEFYLWMSVGGVLGGLFNVLVAPLVFSMVTEYPLEIALACLFAPQLLGKGVGTLEDVSPGPFSGPAADRKPRDAVVNLGVPFVAGAMAAGLLALLPAWREATWFRAVLLLAPAVIVYFFVARFTDRPLLFGLSVELVLLVAVTGLNPEGEVLYRERSFYGILRVTRDPEGQYVQLFHGGTNHGEQRQSTDPEERDRPRTYYYPTGPIGQVFEAFSGPQAKQQVALVGLGPGSLAHYGEAGQEMTFYEIDPAVVKIAQRDFTFLETAERRRVTIRIVLGDARLSLAREPDGRFGLIVLDAFSSDAIPVHLLTREALRDVYLRKLADDGLLAFHVSNRYLDLQPVLGDLAADLGLVCRSEVDAGDERVGKAASIWVIVARKEADLGPLASDPRWHTLAGRPGERVWCDDYSNLLRVFRWSAPPASDKKTHVGAAREGSASGRGRS